MGCTSSKPSPDKGDTSYYTRGAGGGAPGAAGAADDPNTNIIALNGLNSKQSQGSTAASLSAQRTGSNVSAGGYSLQSGHQDPRNVGRTKSAMSGASVGNVSVDSASHPALASASLSNRPSDGLQQQGGISRSGSVRSTHSRSERTLTGSNPNLNAFYGAVESVGGGVASGVNTGNSTPASLRSGMAGGPRVSGQSAPEMEYTSLSAPPPEKYVARAWARM